MLWGSLVCIPLFSFRKEKFICIVLLLGRIPLRHLVYRVHSLPESLRPLVWDFGQLKPEIEELYTRQIVSRFVSGHITV